MNYLVMPHNRDLKSHHMNYDCIYTCLFSKIELLVGEAYVILIGVLAKQLKQLLLQKVQ